MKTDILDKYSTPQAYLEELVYQLNEDYPASKFKLEENYDVWCIYTDDEEFIKNYDVVSLIEIKFFQKFEYTLFHFMYKTQQ